MGGAGAAAGSSLSDVGMESPAMVAFPVVSMVLIPGCPLTRVITIALVGGGVEIADIVGPGAVPADPEAGADVLVRDVGVAVMSVVAVVTSVVVVVAGVLGWAVLLDEHPTIAVRMAAGRSSPDTSGLGQARNRDLRPPTLPTLPSHRPGPSFRVTATRRRVIRRTVG